MSDKNQQEFLLECAVAAASIVLSIRAAVMSEKIQLVDTISHFFEGSGNRVLVTPNSSAVYP